MKIISKTNSIFLTGLWPYYLNNACYMSFQCWIFGSHSSNYEEFYLLRYSAVWSSKNQPTFWWYISPLLFRPDESGRQETSDALLSAWFMFVYWRDYYSILNTEAKCSSETSVDFQRTTWRYIPFVFLLLSFWFNPFNYIQGVPGGKVNTLRGHSIGHSKHELYMYVCPIPNCFRDRAISLYTVQTSNTPCSHTGCEVHWCWRWNFKKCIIPGKLYQLCHVKIKYRY
jgi:hypothetical protein